jgi:glucoamylase
VLLAAGGSLGVLAAYRWRTGRHGRGYQAPPRGAEVDNIAVWRFDNDCLQIAAGKRLRIEVTAPAVVHWSTDRWQTVQDVPTVYSGGGIHRVDLDTNRARPGSTILFTFFWPEVNRWEAEDFFVRVAEAARHA